MTAQAIPYGEQRSSTRADRRSIEGGPRVFPLAFFVLGVVALFFAMIFLRISLDQTAFELDRIERSISAEESRQLDLRYDLAGLQDPLRIATEAQRIGLVYPAERVTIVVDYFVGDASLISSEAPVRAMDSVRP
ncbi:MAG: hypothetical protein ABFR95_09465 [Actinomycetota bacterium]